MSDSTNFEGELIEQPWTINRAKITSATIADVTFTNAPQGLGAVTSAYAGNLKMDADACTATVTEEETNAGTYNTATVTVEEDKCANFTGSIDNVSWSITSIEITQLVLSDNPVYTVKTKHIQLNL